MGNALCTELASPAGVDGAGGEKILRFLMEEGPMRRKKAQGICDKDDVGIQCQSFIGLSGPPSRSTFMAQGIGTNDHLGFIKSVCVLRSDDCGHYVMVG